MLFIKLMRYFLGFVRFKIYGDYPERLVNQLGSKEIPVWNISRNGDCICADMFLKDYKRIREYRAKNRVKTKVTGRYGLPFGLHRYKRRVGLAAGAVIFAVGLFMFPKYIWNVSVIGNSEIDTKVIIDALGELGIREGTPISFVDTRKLPAELKLKVDGIAWAAINIEGTKANVNITESIKAQVEDKLPSNLIADRDGTVTMLLVTGGALKTRVGETVRKGDLLVSGIVDYKEGGSGFVRSSGKVLARTRERIEVTVDLEQKYTVRTGRTETRSIIRTPLFDLPMFLGDPVFSYERQVSETLISTEGGYIPIKKITALFYETEERIAHITTEAAEKQAMAMLEMRETEEFENSEIISREIKTEAKEDRFILTAEYICERNIAREEKLLFGTVN